MNDYLPANADLTAFNLLLINANLGFESPNKSKVEVSLFEGLKYGMCPCIFDNYDFAKVEIPNKSGCIKMPRVNSDQRIALLLNQR